MAPYTPVRVHNASTVQVQGAFWRVWTFMVVLIGIIHELTGPHYPSCDSLHSTKKVLHRDVVADLANCQEESGHFGKCLTPGSYDATSLTTQFVQRIPQGEGPPFPALPLPHHRPELYLWRLIAGKSWFERKRWNENNLTNFQIDALLKWQSCNIPTERHNYRGVDTACAFDVFDNLFFGGALRLHVKGPTWEAQPGKGDLLHSQGSRTPFSIHPTTNTTTAHIFLHYPTHATFSSQFYISTTESIQEIYAYLLEEMIKSLLKIYTCPLCNIPPPEKDFLPCLLNRTLGATTAGPQYRRLKLALQSSASRTLAPLLPPIYAKTSQPWSMHIGLWDDRAMAVSQAMGHVRNNHMSSPSSEDWAIILSETGRGEVSRPEKDTVLE